jgi:hypothetical protein
MPLLLGTGAGLEPDSPWDSRAVWQTPIWLQLWLMGAVFPVFVIALLFCWREKEARWAVVGFIVSHIPVFFAEEVLTVGWVGVIHLICWGPAFAMLVHRLPRLSPTSLYGAWAHAATFVIFVCLVFDARSALHYAIGAIAG